MSLFPYYKNIFFLFIINFCIKPIWVFCIERQFQNQLGDVVYGNYFYLLGIIYIYSVMMDMGLHNYIVKSISDKSYNLSAHFYHFLFLKFFLILLFFMAICITAFYLQMSIDEVKILLLIASSQILFSIYGFIRTFGQGLHRYFIDSWLSSLDRIFLILIGSMVLYSFHYHITIYTFIYIQLIAFSICIIIGLILLFQANLPTRYDYSYSELRLIILNSLPLTIITILMTLYTRLDVILLNHLIPNGDFHCGVYAQSYRFIDSSYNALYLLSLFLLPSIASKNPIKDYHYIKKILLSSICIATISSLIFIVISFYFADIIYHYMYHVTLDYPIRTFRYGLLSTLGIGWMYIFGSYLTATGRFKSLIYIVLGGLLLQLLCSYYFIPKYQAIGASISSSIVQLTMGLLHGLVAIYYLRKAKLSTI